jgi:hypothetical protein
MNIEDALGTINSIVRCVEWRDPGNVFDRGRCPTGQEYVEHKWFADKELFDDPEDALCRILISQVKTEVTHSKNLLRMLELEGKPILFWRIMPEVEVNSILGGKIHTMYARYIVSPASHHWNGGRAQIL